MDAQFLGKLSISKCYKRKVKAENRKAPRDNARVWRGGAFGNNDGNVRCAYRNRRNPLNWDDGLGFRVAVLELCM